MRIEPNSVNVWMQENIPLVEMELWDDNGFVDKDIFTIEEIVEMALSSTNREFHVDLIAVKDLMETVGRFWFDELKMVL